MKSSWRIGLLLAAAGLLIGPSVLRGGTSDVFRVQTTLAGTAQFGVLSNGIIRKLQITSDDFINLALGRQLGTPVPKNELLTLVNDCTTNNLRLTVFDSAAGSNLLTVGTLSNLTASSFTRRKYVETITQLTLNDLSAGGSNGIAGGSFYYHGRIKVTTNGCPTSFGGQLTGFLGTAFPYVATNVFATNFVISCLSTNCGDTNCITSCSNRVDVVTDIFTAITTFNVIIPRTHITTGKSIGKLVE